MVTSDNGRSVHDDTQEYEDAEAVDDVGLDSGGFVSNPKQVSRTDAVSVDRSGYGLRERDYSHGDFGSFGPEDDVFEVFSSVMGSPTEELEDDQRAMTDGGVPNGSPFYREEDEESLYDGENERPITDGGRPKMSEVDHEGPYGDEEGGAPW